MPKVSVIIPTFNYGRFVGEAIQSVLAQTFVDFELIVVDDGSTDNTKEVVGSVRDPRIGYKYYENRGPAAARNRGIELSCGEYIAFLDADDILMENALEKGVEVLDKHPEVGFSYGQAYIEDENGRLYRMQKSSFLDGSAIVDGKEQIRELLFFKRIPTSTFMVRRRCFAELGGAYEGLNFAEDHHLFIRLAKRFPVAYIAQPLVKVRIHPSGLHRNVDPRLAERAYLLIIKEVFDDPDLAPYFKPWKSLAYSSFYRRIGDYAYGKDMRLTRHYLREAVRVYPQIMLRADGISVAYLYAKSFLPNKLRQTLGDLKWHFLDSSKRLGE